MTPDLSAGAWMDVLMEAVCIVDPSTMRIAEANAAATRLLRCRPEDIVGRPVVDLFRMPEDQFFWEEVGAHDPARAPAPALLSHTRLQRPDGTVVHVERSVRQVRPGAGAAAYLVGMIERDRQHEAEEKLEETVAELRATLESTADGILVCGLDGTVRAFNRRFAQLWDVPGDLLEERDGAALHAYLAECVTDAQRYAERLAEIADGTWSERYDLLRLRSGQLIERTTLPQRSRGRVTGQVFCFRDVTDRTAADDALKLAAKVFASSPDAVFITDSALRIASVNPACLHLSQRSEGGLIGCNAIDLFDDADSGRLLGEIQRCWEEGGVWEGDLWHRRGDGGSIAVRLSWVVQRDDQGRLNQTIGFFSDLTGLHAQQRRIEELAYTDALTGLPNRLLLSRRVERNLQQRGGTEAPFAILFMDLDHFKNINDSLGHQFGDRVLIQVAQRINACLRQVDTLCRLGGDEFVLYIHQADAEGAELVVRRILDSMAQPFTLDDIGFSVGCSVGVALYPRDGQTLDELIKQADTAMFRVKGGSRGGYRFYEPQMSVNLLSRMKMEHAMRQALEQEQFRLHYQPQVALDDGALMGAEALIRWTDAERGPVSPAVFIPLAEESGFIVAIGAWVLREAARQAAEWERAGTPVVVSVNVSAMQFRQADFLDRVRGVLEESGLSPHLMELELTETILVQDADETLERLHALAAIGVRMAIDDFGTGYSSLAYLKKFPIQKLKIDRSFVDGLPDDASDQALVSAMVSMGRALDFAIVAEGVETEAQRDSLIALGCGQYQGYLCSPGLPAEEFARTMLSARARAPKETALTGDRAAPSRKKVSAGATGPAS
ncbi:MAG: EAL domain-containing protein [Xylophilus ampelinus]